MWDLFSYPNPTTANIDETTSTIMETASASAFRRTVGHKPVRHGSWTIANGNSGAEAPSSVSRSGLSGRFLLQKEQLSSEHIGKCSVHSLHAGQNIES